MYIGSKEVVNIKDIDGNLIEVTVKDGSPFEINKELYESVASEEAGEGTITDVVNNYFARKFMAELAYYGLEYYFAENISMALRVLAHNLREQKISEKFGVSSSDSIRISEILNEK